MSLMMNDRAVAQTTATGVATDVLSYGTSACALGEVLVARSSKGVCALLIGDTAEELEANLTVRFPKSTIVENDLAVRDDLVKVVRFMKKPTEGVDLTLDMRGTPFQCLVWEKLRDISAGRTVTYTELAKAVSPLSSARAVAGACAANPIALATPCHRVVRSDGDLAGFRWGIERKRELIQREAMA
jgi:AraC family transcriptional regulator, regulatory protein of adaptative response / methylated-DNA-[protein]-cysteine methyltransferase